MLLATLEESVQRSVREATATLHEEIGVLKARLLRAESDDDESDDDSSDSSDDSSTNSLRHRLLRGTRLLTSQSGQSTRSTKRPTLPGC